MSGVKLAEGRHTLAVRAANPLPWMPDVEVQREFTVDATPPALRVDVAEAASPRGPVTVTTALGDVVNTASRLQSSATAGHRTSKECRTVTRRLALTAVLAGIAMTAVAPLAHAEPEEGHVAAMVRLRKRGKMLHEIAERQVLGDVRLLLDAVNRRGRSVDEALDPGLLGGERIVELGLRLL